MKYKTLIYVGQFLIEKGVLLEISLDKNTFCQGKGAGI